MGTKVFLLLFCDGLDLLNYIYSPPPAYMIEKGKNGFKYFKKALIDGRDVYMIKSMDEYMEVI